MSGNLTPDTTVALLKATETQSAGALKNIKNAKQLEKIAGAAEEFEAVFVAEMMKPMFEGLETDGLFGGGKGEEVFKGLLLQEYGKITASTGRIGIADAVKTELIKLQEQQA